MEDIIKDMITYANDHHDYEMADFGLQDNGRNAKNF